MGYSSQLVSAEQTATAGISRVKNMPSTEKQFPPDLEVELAEIPFPSTTAPQLGLLLWHNENVGISEAMVNGLVPI